MKEIKLIEMQSSEYVGSYVKLNQCPAPIHPEYAFIGRSNVGKSSLINMLSGKKKLAKVSTTPGKTQTLNYFIIDKNWYLVDLPGYGYAKISKSMRKKWELMIRNYLVKRENLMCIFLLIDGTIPPQKNDLDFANWMGEMDIPFNIIYTKTDKLGTTKKLEFVKQFQKAMLEFWTEMPTEFVTSSKNQAGKQEILKHIYQINKDNRENLSRNS